MQKLTELSVSGSASGCTRCNNMYRTYTHRYACELFDVIERAAGKSARCHIDVRDFNASIQIKSTNSNSNSISMAAFHLMLVTLLDYFIQVVYQMLNKDKLRWSTSA